MYLLKLPQMSEILHDRIIDPETLVMQKQAKGITGLWIEEQHNRITDQEADNRLSPSHFNSVPICLPLLDWQVHTISVRASHKIKERRWAISEKYGWPDIFLEWNPWKKLTGITVNVSRGLCYC